MLGNHRDDSDHYDGSDDCTGVRQRLARIEALLAQWDLWDRRRALRWGESRPPRRPPSLSRQALEMLREQVQQELAHWTRDAA
jgi:hypothetical protein